MTSQHSQPVTRLTQSAAANHRARSQDGDSLVQRSHTTIGDDRRFHRSIDEIIIEETDSEANTHRSEAPSDSVATPPTAEDAAPAKSPLSSRRKSTTSGKTSSANKAHQRRTSVVHAEKKLVNRQRTPGKQRRSPGTPSINFVGVPDDASSDEATRAPPAATEDEKSKTAPTPSDGETSPKSASPSGAEGMSPREREDDGDVERPTSAPKDPSTELAYPYFSRQPAIDDSKSDSHVTTTSIPDIMADAGWDTDLEQDDPEAPTSRSHGVAVYVESCRNQGVIPASYFLRNIETGSPELDMKHHGLGPEGVKPLAVALVSNTNVLQLNLSDNWLGVDGGVHVCHMLMENCYVTELNLSDNNLGADFTAEFSKVLAVNTTLTDVTLAGNRIDDKAAAALAEGLANNDQLETLSLSRNQLSEGAGYVLGAVLADNVSLKKLDLSWNAIRRKGAHGMAMGVKQNTFLEQLDLSWNGLGNEGSLALGEALKHNDTLLHLDISNNRILTQGAVMFGKGLSANETLQRLYMGKNPMQTGGCYAIVAAILRNPNSAITKLDFSDILVNRDFWELYEKLKEQIPCIELRHGGDYAKQKPKARVHPMVRLKHYIDKQNIRLVDFFNRFDKDGSMSVTRDEFAEGIEIFCQEVGIKLTQEEITSLLDDLDKDGDGEINYSELVMGHQDFSDKEKRTSSTTIAAV